MECKRINTDLYAGVFITAVSIFFWSQIGNFTNFGIMFPRAIIIIQGITGIGLLIRGIVKKEITECFEIAYLFKMIAVIVFLILWVRLLNVVGFAVTSFVSFILIALTIENERSFKNITKTIIISAGLVGIFYIVFARILLVRLPGGILF